VIFRSGQGSWPSFGEAIPAAALGLGIGNAARLRSLGMTAKEYDEFLKFALSSDPMSWFPFAAGTLGFAGADAASKIKP
jgi:hypothetical protein